MAIKSANLAPTATSTTLATGPATLHNIHWTTSTAGNGSFRFHDGTSTGASLRLVIDTPDANKHGSGNFEIGGGGMTFSASIYVNKSSAGGLTIVYATGV